MQFKAKMKKLASQNHVTALAVLKNFMMERLLDRISVSSYRDKFVLKGGMLISSLVGIHTRTTMDMDTTLQGYPLSKETLTKALMDICSIPLEDDVHLFFYHIAPSVKMTNTAGTEPPSSRNMNPFGPH